MYSIRRKNRAHEGSSKQHTQNSKGKRGREERCEEYAIEIGIVIVIEIVTVIVKGSTSIYTHRIKRKKEMAGMIS